MQIARLLLALTVATASLAGQKTKNVILVTLDGVRWQDVFGGADPALVNKDVGGVKDLLAFRRRFWRGDATARRQLLMPFLWGTVAKEGQVFGDPAVRCEAKVENSHHFSYPGYHELLCGFPEPAIDSNAKRPNPNKTVFEWLAVQAGFSGRVAAFGTWDVFPYILNIERSGIYMRACRDVLEVGLQDARLQVKNQLLASLPHYWDDCAFDVAAFEGIAEYLPAREPRAMYVALGETDCWAHERRYDMYCESLQRADRWLGGVWAELQTMPDYAGKTSLVITVDHGRGEAARWTDHDNKTPGADRIWFAVLGPDTPALGVRGDVAVTQGQTAASVAQLLGLDWCAAELRARPALPGVR
jgi:hypothetical protein